MNMSSKCRKKIDQYRTECIALEYTEGDQASPVYRSKEGRDVPIVMLNRSLGGEQEKQAVAPEYIIQFWRFNERAIARCSAQTGHFDKTSGHLLQVHLLRQVVMIISKLEPLNRALSPNHATRLLLTRSLRFGNDIYTSGRRSSRARSFHWSRYSMRYLASEKSHRIHFLFVKESAYIRCGGEYMRTAAG